MLAKVQYKSGQDESSPGDLHVTGVVATGEGVAGAFKRKSIERRAKIPSKVTRAIKVCSENTRYNIIQVEIMDINI